MTQTNTSAALLLIAIAITPAAANTAMCEAGYYQYEDECMLCPYGYYCPGDDTMIRCPLSYNGKVAGTYVDENLSGNGAPTITRCIDFAVPLTFAHGTGTIRCFYNPESGLYDDRCHNQNATFCDEGYACHAYSAGCDYCSTAGVGYWSPDGDIERYPCPTGYTTSGETSMSVADCNICAAGYEYVSGTCSPCKAGYYKSNAGNTSCTLPDAGYYASGCADTSTACTGYTQCENGYYCTGDGIRVQCPRSYNNKTAQTYVNDEQLGNGATRSTQCIDFAVSHIFVNGTGTKRCIYNPDSGLYDSGCHQYTATSCNGGYVCNERQTTTGTRLCDDCIQAGIGYWSSDGDIERHTCPDGTSTHTETSTDESDCHALCKAGITQLHTDGTSVPIWKDKPTVHNLHIEYNNSVCYVGLSAGHAPNAINVEIDNNTYHTVR